MQNKKNFVQPEPTPDHITRVINAMLANLIGEDDISNQLVRPIVYTDLPEDLVFQRLVMDKLQWHFEHHYAPTRENILNALLIHKDIIGDPTTVFEQLMACRTEDRDPVSLASLFWEWKLQKNAKELWQQGLEEPNRPYGTVQERTERALSIVEGIAPAIEDAVAMDDKKRYEDWKKRQKERWNKAQKGEALGPTFPFKGLSGGEKVDTRTGERIDITGKIPVLMWGEMTLISGLPGSGKSTVSWKLAEHTARTQGFVTLILHCETNTDILEMREISRNCKIPFHAQSTG